MEEIKFKDGRESSWWGYGDYFCTSPACEIKILLPYKSEPPHGDSYHNLIINSKTIRGYIWSGYFLWSKCGNYLTCHWLEGMKGYFEGKVWHTSQIQRATIVVSPTKLQYRIVIEPSYKELNLLRREGAEDELWNILLDPDGSPWEDFF
jgi:hypothetical protein